AGPPQSPRDAGGDRGGGVRLPAAPGAVDAGRPAPLRTDGGGGGLLRRHAPPDALRRAPRDAGGGGVCVRGARDLQVGLRPVPPAPRAGGYSRIVILFIRTGVMGRSPASVGVFSIFLTTSMPSITRPKTGCLEGPGVKKSR